MTSFEIRPAVASDLPRMMSLDHSSLSDYVWQLELRREAGQASANFREVRLPRSIEVRYPRNPSSLADEWMRRDLVLVVLNDGSLIGYLCAIEERTSEVAWVTDMVVAPNQRRKGAASALLTATQTWALERDVRRLILEMQSKNHGCIRLAQKFGYDFCGYNDQYYPTQDVALFFGRAIK
ncbi:MAG: GNAT family N-acetyltransferase [Anaerolineae bacterium]|nr:GNAT family N-acetyltransferase [Anaerolineae bacterium]MCI0609364.1 GNAT family N-acetyltransferase [Anaerolineae bacterium]